MRNNKFGEFTVKQTASKVNHCHVKFTVASEGNKLF